MPDDQDRYPFDWRKSIGPPTPGNVFIWILVVTAFALAIVVVSTIASWAWQHS